MIESPDDTANRKFIESHRTSRLSVATHEAGHAVVAHGLGRTVKKLKLSPDRRYPGMDCWLGLMVPVHVPRNTGNYTVGGCYVDAAIDIAGNLAQALLADGRPSGEEIELHGEVVGLIADETGDSPHVISARIYDRVMLILGAHADTVHAVAAELDRRGVLCASALATLLSPVKTELETP